MSESVFFHTFDPDTDSMKGGGDIHVSAAHTLRWNSEGPSPNPHTLKYHQPPLLLFPLPLFISYIPLCSFYLKAFLRAVELIGFSLVSISRGLVLRHRYFRRQPQLLPNNGWAYQRQKGHATGLAQWYHSSTRVGSLWDRSNLFDGRRRTIWDLERLSGLLKIW